MTRHDRSDPVGVPDHGVPADALAQALLGVPDRAGVIVLMRHSLRERPDDDAPGFAAPLTAAGVELARAAGAQLHRQPTRLVSSPAPRCIATARALALGADADDDPRVEELPLLAEPRAFAADLDVAGPFFLQNGARGWVQGVLADPARVGARDPVAGTLRILDALRPHAPDAGGLSVAVTHDTVLAIVLHVLAERRDREEGLWPRMLEALLLWWEADGVHWRWRERGGAWRAP